MQARLTDVLVKQTRPPTTGRLEIFDTNCRGLALRISSNDVRSWSVRLFIAGKIQRATLGKYPHISLMEARQRADQLRRRVEHGEDPIATKRQQKVESDRATFPYLAERYLKEHAFRHKRPESAKQDQRNIAKHLLPYWNKRQYPTITRADIVERIEAVAETHPILANRMCALVSKMFSFAIDVGLMTSSPALRLKKPGKERAKTRVLTDAEIRLFWTGIVEAPVSRPTGLALRLALLLGLRAGEIASLRRDELRDLGDIRRATIELPGERTKNGQPHLVPLSPLALQVLDEALGLSNNDFVFSGTTEGEAIESHSLTTAMRRFGEQLKGDDPAAATWKRQPATPHDLRRSLATRLGSLGIDEGVIGRILNHVPQGVTRKHYNHFAYEPQKRAALGAWSVALQAILDGKSSTNVVAMGRARRR